MALVERIFSAHRGGTNARHAWAGQRPLVVWRGKARSVNSSDLAGPNARLDPTREQAEAQTKRQGGISERRRPSPTTQVGRSQRRNDRTLSRLCPA